MSPVGSHRFPSRTQTPWTTTTLITRIHDQDPEEPT